MGTNLQQSLSSQIQLYADTLLRDGKIGICAGNIRITDVKTGCNTLSQEQCGDRFKIIIPYAGHSLTWEVLFNKNADDPPDFIFGPDDQDFWPETENLQHLVNWNSKDPQCFQRLIQELLEQYKKYHQSLIDSYSRLQFEYSSLKEQGFSTDDVEVYAIRKKQNELGQVNFLIKLHVDFSRIPAYLTQNNPGEDSAVLLVMFHSPGGSKVTPQLFLSPRVEHAFGGTSSLRIPAFHNGVCLLDYVPNICELLKNKVEQVVLGHEKRKEYVAAFLSHFGRSVIEYDAEGFFKISLLWEWNDFFFVIHAKLPLYFPVDAPTLQLQSVYHESNGKPFTWNVEDYPYSPRWSGNEMVDRLRLFVLDNISNFQRASVQNGNLNS